MEEDNNKKNNENINEYITINLDTGDISEEENLNFHKTESKRSTRIDKTVKNKKEKKKWSKKKKIVVAISTVFAVLAIIGVVLATYIFKANGNITEAVINMATDIVGNDEPIFVLVLGISEDITSKLTDTIILAGYNPETQKAFMLSIPRDTFVGTNENTASGWDKINALYQKDISKTVAAVEERTGINIDKYVIVRNTMLPAIVNAIGEVEFDVPIDMDYDDPTQNLHIHLKKGTQMINGEKAEYLLRFRHNNDGSSYPAEYGDNDYGRMRTQREFMKVVAKQLISVNSTSNLKSIAEAVFANLETNMSITEAIGYIPYALKFNVDDIRMEQLPGSGAMLNELSFYKASYAKSKKLMGELIEFLGLDEKEKEKYYTGKIKQTIAATKEEKEQDECDHKYKSEITRNSTCEKQGERKYTCSLCNSTYTEEIATTTHNYDSNGKCSNCGVEKETDEHECKFTKLVHTELPATCIENGEATYRCEYCKNTKNLIIEKTGKHTYDENGKCTTSGCTAVKDDTANKENTKPEEKPKECNHNFVETRTEATCTTAGSVTKKCSICQETKTETIKATGHKFVESDKKASTCTTDGSVTKKCSACQETKTETIKATGHKFVETSQTCTNSGCTESNPNYKPADTTTQNPSDQTAVTQ